ncbi:rluC [Symbiodinium necroappetens]|uniref:RluC protein n=1 Tax=Symbiodinium necroappetens TaxID=1628268 RepID=A0A812YC60_9DINO|nr:rluC [Symbiodinium necroappetens]
MPPTIAEVKGRLNFVWGKESDLNETYSFEFASSTSWSCVRKNGAESRKFRLTFDAAASRLWWGESYFMDPSDMAKQPDRVQWYRASDRSKKRAAFLWKRLREAQPGNVEVRKNIPAPPRPKAAVARNPASVGKARTEAVSTGSKSKTSPVSWPEVVLDLDQMLVLYKPPHWKVELPPKGTPEEGLHLPSWLRDKVASIDPKLFEEESNPALSGTGFGPLSHRIDQETSGPLLAAKTAAAQRHLRAQFHKTEISKRYVCLVHGRVSSPSGTVDASIRTLRTDATTRSEISSAGDWAETQYQVIATFGSASVGRYSLLACDITSGRTHQIRVHMQHLGHPLVSDDKYGDVGQLEKDRIWCPRLFLHSFRLRFRDLRNEVQEVVCPLPPDLKAALVKLGAASPDGPSADALFGETSWQREIFRPPLTAWRPGTEVQRCLISLLLSKDQPRSLHDINADAELKRLLAKENLTCINKAWLAKNWDVFEALPSPDDDLTVRLRPLAEGSERQLEQQIEAVRSECEELQRLKQRAIAEEQYLKAAEIKRRFEAASAELSSLLTLCEDESVADDALAEGRIAAARQQIKAFEQDVNDEALFPSLAAAPKPRAVPETDDPLPAEGLEVKPPSLEEALMDFLDRKEGNIAHINEINNDRYLREVMAQQAPKPISAVNKVWLKQHEALFTLLRAQDNEMYIARTQAVADQKKAKAKMQAGDQKKQPAYHQVIQKADQMAAPLVYQYGGGALKPIPEQEESGPWQERLRQALQAGPLEVPELLQAVPLFTAATGATRPWQQQEILLTFLQAWPQLFKVEKRGSGADRKYLVSLK